MNRKSSLRYWRLWKAAACRRSWLEHYGNRRKRSGSNVRSPSGPRAENSCRCTWLIFPVGDLTMHHPKGCPFLTDGIERDKKVRLKKNKKLKEECYVYLVEELRNNFIFI